jgi:hypothetical protein
MTIPITENQMCAQCGSPIAVDARFCEVCGARRRMQGPDDIWHAPMKRPVSRSATRSVIFGLLPFAVNIVANLVGRVLSANARSSNPGQTFFLASLGSELFVFVVSRLAVGVLLVFTYIYAARGLRETRDDSLAGRGRARLGLVLAIFGSVGLVLSIIRLVTGIVMGLQSEL